MAWSELRVQSLGWVSWIPERIRSLSYLSSISYDSMVLLYEHAAVRNAFDYIQLCTGKVEIIGTFLCCVT